jgi:hypothetical protein
MHRVYRYGHMTGVLMYKRRRPATCRPFVAHHQRARCMHVLRTDDRALWPLNYQLIPIICSQQHACMCSPAPRCAPCAPRAPPPPLAPPARVSPRPVSLRAAATRAAAPRWRTRRARPAAIKKVRIVISPVQVRSDLNRAWFVVLLYALFFFGINGARIAS